MITKIRSEQYGVNTYLVDTPAEIKDLPMNTGIGSAALSLQDGKIYMLNGSKKWAAFGEEDEESEEGGEE